MSHLPYESSIERLVGGIVLEENDAWVVQRARCMTLETIAPLGDNLSIKLPAVAV